MLKERKMQGKKMDAIRREFEDFLNRKDMNLSIASALTERSVGTLSKFLNNKIKKPHDRTLYRIKKLTECKDGDFSRLFWLRSRDIEEVLKNGQGQYSRGFRRMRLLALERDRHQCQVCGAKDNIIIHHKNNIKTDNKLDNLITLCQKCHFKIHSNGIKKPHATA
jgi:hypothetical protein